MTTQAVHQRALLFVLVALLVVALIAGSASIAAQQTPTGDQPSDVASGEAFRSSPVMFVENAGQWDERARFQVWSGPAETMWLAEDTIWITVVERSADDDGRSQADTLERFDPQRANMEPENVPSKAANIKLSFVGANPHPRIEPFDRLETKVSYFIGNDPEKWRPEVPVWGGVRYVDLYPSVDLEITGEDGQVKHRIIWRDTDQATREALESQRLLRVDVGDSVVTTELANLNNDSLYDMLSGEASLHLRSEVRSVQSPDGTALVYSTFLGGNQNSDIAVDAAGSAFITGWTGSSFPTTQGSFQTASPGGNNAFVAKLNPAGTALVYATFVGGGNTDIGEGIALDSAGAAYLTGWTWSTNFPTTAGAYQRNHKGGTCMLVDELPCADVFVTKLAASGSALVYSTLIGGAQYDVGKDIKVDQTGAVYVVGYTYSWDFPVTGGAYQKTYKGGRGDAFVAKLNATGSGLTYSTFLGGTGGECNDMDDAMYPMVCSLAIDSSGAAYVTGYTSSNDFPTTANAFSTGRSNAFVTKLGLDGGTLVYSTYLGSSWGYTWFVIARGIAVDQSGSAYVTGYTDTHLFPTTSGAFQTSIRGQDAFVTKFAPSGSTLAYSTFLGGSSDDEGYDIAVDANGEAYVVGITNSSDFPTTADAFDGTRSSSPNDVFVVRLGAAGNNVGYATLLGGGSTSSGPTWSIAAFPTRLAYVTGQTRDASFPTTSGTYRRQFRGGEDVFVTKMGMGDTVVPAPSATPTRTLTPSRTPTPTRTPTPAIYTISGRVTEAGGFTGIGGVTVWADATHSTTTNANGDYTLTGLSAGTYSVRPSLTPYAFSPASRLVSVPTNQTEVNFRKVVINKVQVNQALGNTTNYVAGKDTVIQVVMSDYVPYGQANQQVVVKRDGAYVTTLKPLKPAFPTQTLNFWGKMEDCGNWEQGGYTFEATVNGSQMVQDAVRFSERRSLRILAVPVKIKVNGEVLIPSDRWKSAEQFVRQTYPVANKGILYQPADRMLDGTFWDLTTEGGRTALFLELSLYQPVSCTLGLGPCYDAIFGIIPQAQLCPSLPCTEGWTSWPPAAVVMDNKNLPTIMAHELGHGLGYNHLFVVPGLGDEYGGQCGVFQCDDNPPPQNYLGKTSTYGSCSHHCSDATVQPWDSWMGSAVLPEDGPFEVGGRLGLGRKLSFMGAAGENQSEYWVTLHAYDSLFGQLAPRAGAAATLATERVADVRGWIQQDDHASLDPAYYLDAVAPPVAAGPYSVEVLDTGGAILSSQGFDVSFVLLSNPPQDIEQAYFRVAVRFPQGARTVRVKHGAAVLAQRAVSAYAPGLSLTSPTAGQTWAATGNHTIRWQGNDLDGDALHYTVLYRQGAGDWGVLGADLTANELTVDAADLPGGTAAQVQVLATDGINTTTAESDLFTVGHKPPEAFITFPAEGASFMPGVSLFLQGTAYDLEDGTLPNSAYRWKSDKDGDLGAGASNLVILSPGPHIITLTVTDSAGNTAVKTIRLSAGYQVSLPTILRGR